jgi:hypothetical protein
MSAGIKFQPVTCGEEHLKPESRLKPTWGITLAWIKRA